MKLWDHDFFRREHIIQAVWALFIAFIAFLGGLVYSSFAGPEEVVVRAPLNRADTVLVRVIAPDSAATASNTSQSANAIQVLGDSLRSDLRQIQKTLAQSRNPTSQQSRALDSLDRLLGARDQLVAGLASAPNQLQSPPFPFSTRTRGYLLASFAGYGGGSCSPVTVSRQDLLHLFLRTNPSTTISDLTPLYVVVTRGSTVSGAFQFENQYTLREGTNHVVLYPDWEPGAYYIQFGVFRKDGLETKYPHFLRVTCTIQVTT